MEWSSEKIIDFGAKNHCRYSSGSRKFILWPVWGWQVIMPKYVPKKFNALQRLVLRLYISGHRDSTMIGELLEFDPELIEYVVSELKGKGFLDQHNKPTEKGKKALSDDESTFEAEELQKGWVFKNAISKEFELFPKFIAELSLAAVEKNEQNYPLILSGTKGNPLKNRAFILPHKNSPSMPTPGEICTAAFRHRRQEKRYELANIESGITVADSSDDVSFISQSPQRLHLVTFLYIPEESEPEDYPWYVADPFGFGASHDLRNQLNTYRKESSGELRNILDKITGMANEKLIKNHQQMQRLFEEEADVKMHTTFPLCAFQYDKGILDQFRKAFMDIERYNTNSNPRRDVSSTYIYLRTALERALSLCLIDFPPREAWKKVYGSKHPLPWEVRKKFISECGKEIGFSPIPEQIKNAKAGTIKWLCKSDSSSTSSLSPAIAAAMLSASDYPNHPFFYLAKHAPNWLEMANQTIKVCGKNAHAQTQKKEEPDALEQLKNETEHSAKLIKLLLEAIQNSTNKKTRG